MKSNVKRDIEKIILNVQKPASYTGNELNIIVKKDPFVRIALSYPDLYEIGMSNNGIRILYDIVNKIDSVACERVFAVAPDFEKLLRDENIPLYTLESFTPLNRLDLLGFNLAHELLYTNILQILDLGKIPILSKDRTDDDPLVIAGGDSVSNPFPILDFIDAFFIGDGEEGIVDMVNVLVKAKKRPLKRKEILELFSEIEGVMVSSEHGRFYADNRNDRAHEKIVNKRIYKQMGPINPMKPIVPNIRIVQERAVLELTKGCRNLCKFCHAGYFHLPYRPAALDEIKNELRAIVGNTGYNEVSFSSLSISDYKSITGLLNSVMPVLTEQGISVSLPSLRVDKRTIPIIEQVSGLRKTSLTFAVESASEVIRSIANKRVLTEELLSIIDYIYKKGWRLIKLYFMIGLPGYDKHDEAESIILLLNKILTITQKKIKINVTLSPFVPKPHTPFEREKQVGTDYFNDTILKIKRGVPGSVKIKNHDVDSSMLEGILSRGDDRLGDVIYNVYLKGCRFDSWKEHFKFGIWKKTLDEKIPNWSTIFNEKKDDEFLPWSVIHTGFENVKNSMKNKNFDSKKNEIKYPEYDEPVDLSSLSDAVEKFERRFNFSRRVRIRFKKRGEAKYIPHIDFIEILKRSFRMASLPVAFTRGFNKREKLSMGFPLPVGIESDSELCDVDLYDELGDNIFHKLTNKLPQGIEAVDFRYIDKKESLMAITCAFEYYVKVHNEKLLQKIVSSLNNKINFFKETKKHTKEVFFEDVVDFYNISDDKSLTFRLYCGTPNSLRIDKVLYSLSHTGTDSFFEFDVIKTGQYRQEDGLLVLID